jgi:hypothetical protein
MNKVLRGSLPFLPFAFVSVLGVVAACSHDGTGMTSGTSGTPPAAVRCNTAKPADNDPPTLTYGPTCEKLVTAYPSIENDEGERDKKVLCPFLRLVYKSQELAAEIAANLKLDSLRDKVFPVSVATLTKSSETFGCEAASCGAILSQASSQLTGKDPKTVTESDIVDLGQLHVGTRKSGDCGFLFALGETAVTDATRADTLAQMQKLSVDGHLTYDNLMQVKKALCRRDFLRAQQGNLTARNPVSASGDSLELAQADIINVAVLYGYLGGIENGYVLYDDVDLFFHGKMPVNKTKFNISFALIQHVNMMMKP